MFLLQTTRNITNVTIDSLENIDRFNRRIALVPFNFRELLPLPNGRYRIYLFMGSDEVNLELPLIFDSIGDLLQLQVEIENGQCHPILRFIDRSHTNLLVFQHNPIFNYYIKEDHTAENITTRPRPTLTKIQWIGYYKERINFLFRDNFYEDVNRNSFFQGLFGTKLLERFQFRTSFQAIPHYSLN